MTVESDADRQELLKTWDPVTIDSNTVYGVFSAGYARTLEFGTAVPEFLCRSADVLSVTAGGSTLTYDEVDYTVMEKQADGTGFSRLVLARA